MNGNSEKTLKFRLLGDTSGLDKALNKSETQTNKLSNTMGKLGKVIATTFTVTAIVGFGKKIMDVGADFESQMARVQAISGATGSELKALEEEARRLGATTMYSATESAKGLEYFAMAGWSVEDSIKALEPTLRLAQASGEDLGAVADIVSDSMTAFGLSSGEAGDFTDLLASVSTKANTNVGMLGESFKYVAPLVGTMGGSAEDTAIALGLMANAGIKGGQAGTSLRSAITRLTNPIGEAKGMMEELGVGIQYNADGSMNLKGTLDNLRESFATLTPEQQAQAGATIFGQEAMAGMLSIINASEEDYNKLTEASRNYTGSAKEMAEVMENTLKGRIANLKSAWEELMLVIYDKLVPAFTVVVEWLTKIIQWLSNLQMNTEGNFGKMGEIIGKFREFFAGVGEKVREIIRIMVESFQNWYRRNQEVIDGVIEKFKIFLENVGSIINGVLDIIKMFIDVFTTYFLDYGINIINGFSTVFMGISQMVKGVVDIVAGILSGDWSRAWEGAKNLLEGVWTAMTGVIEVAVSKIKALVNVVIGLFNKLIEAWNGLQFKVPSIDLPFGMGSFGGFTIGVPKIPKIPLLAEGGIITAPTLAMIGEGGESEAVIPLSKLDSFTNGGQSVVVNVYGSVGVDDIGEQIVTTLRRKGVLSFA